jgi:hypothetical protein
VHRSWLTNLPQTQSFGGEHWTATLYFNVGIDDRNELTGFLTRLNGGEHRVLLPVYKAQQRGDLSGTPLVNGSSQKGTSLAINGAGASKTPWIAQGDWFSVGNELKMATADANSDGSGLVTVNFRPRLHTSPASGAAITVSGVTAKFMLLTPNVQWSVNAWNEMAETSLEFIEDST